VLIKAGQFSEKFKESKMAIEELDDISEEMADKLGIYGEERSVWTSQFTYRVRAALKTEELLRLPATASRDSTI
jgi:hypothetical protein